MVKAKEQAHYEPYGEGSLNSMEGYQYTGMALRGCFQFRRGARKRKMPNGRVGTHKADLSEMDLMKLQNHK